MARTSIGIEIDGGRATIVELRGGAATTRHVITDDDVLARVRGWLDARKPVKVPVRVALVERGTYLRRINVTAASSDRSSVADALYDALPVPREATTVAALVPPADTLPADTVGAAAAVVASLDAVTRVYDALVWPVEVTVPPLCLAGADGLHLFVGFEASVLTLVVGGMPVASRQLAGGGLGAVVTDLGEGGAARVEQLLAGGDGDAIVWSVADRFVVDLVEEVRRTHEHWGRAESDVPSDVVLSGAGTAAPTLAHRLAAAGFGLARHRGADGALHELVPSERAAFVGAYFAAVTAGTGGELAVFTNPQAEAAASRRARARAKLRRAGTIAAAVVALGAVTGVPLAKGRADLQAARAERAAAAARLARLADADRTARRLAALDAAVEHLDARTPRWSVLLGRLRDSAPVGTRITRLRASVGGSSVDVSLDAVAAGGEYAPLTEWLHRLADDVGAHDVWTSGFAVRDGSLRFSLTFRVPTATLEQTR